MENQGAKAGDRMAVMRDTGHFCSMAVSWGGEGPVERSTSLVVIPRGPPSGL